MFDRLLLQKCVHGTKEGTEFFFDNTPHNAVVNGVIAVDKDVSERDDGTVLGDLLQEFGIVAFDPAQGLSNNLEFPLHSASKQFVRGVILECVSGDRMP